MIPVSGTGSQSLVEMRSCVSASAAWMSSLSKWDCMSVVVRFGAVVGACWFGAVVRGLLVWRGG